MEDPGPTSSSRQLVLNTTRRGRTCPGIAQSKVGIFRSHLYASFACRGPGIGVPGLPMEENTPKEQYQLDNQAGVG